jgi:hypothetical protein
MLSNVFHTAVALRGQTWAGTRWAALSVQHAVGQALAKFPPVFHTTPLPTK